MKHRSFVRAASAAIAATFALAACASQGDTQPGAEGTGTGEATGGVMRVAETNAFFSFNPDNSNNNMDINAKIVETTRSDWQYIDNDLKLVKNEWFGKIEKLSDNPLKVKYTVNDGMNWSDGNPIDKGDLLLAWAVQSGYFDAPGADAKPKYFSFAGSTDGLGLTAMPEFEGDRSMTLTYSKPYVDWEIALGMSRSQPAHVVATRAGLADEAALVKLFETAEKGKENAQLAKVAKVWNDDFNAKSLPSDPQLYLSSGPMIVKQMVADQSVTLGRNEAFTGENKPKVDEITVRFIGDAAAQIAALRNGEVDIIAPQPTTDTVQQAKALQGTQTLEGPQVAYDHLDLSFDSDVFKDANVRKAFLKTVPRQQIVDRLIKPMYPEAAVLNSQLFLTTEGDAYTNAVQNNDSSQYTDVDIAGAKQLLAGKTPTVRILYNNANPIRVDAYSMIAESARQAGFKIEDNGAADWGQKLGDGSYDASIFGWINPGVGNAGVPQLFSSTGGGNYGKYKNAKVDQMTTNLLTTIDEAQVNQIKVDIDKQLFSDAFGLPLFQSPGLVVHSDAVKGLEFMPNQTGVWWNFWDWSLQQ